MTQRYIELNSKQMEATVNLPMPVGKYRIDNKKLKSKRMKKVRRIRKIPSI